MPGPCIADPQLVLNIVILGILYLVPQIVGRKSERSTLSLSLTLPLTLNLSAGLFHIKKSATSISVEEPQPHDSQNRILNPHIIEFLDFRYITVAHMAA